MWLHANNHVLKTDCTWFTHPKPVKSSTFKIGSVNVYTTAVILKWLYESEGTSVITLFLSVSVLFFSPSMHKPLLFSPLFFSQIISLAISSNPVCAAFPLARFCTIKKESQGTYSGASLPFAPLIIGWEILFKSETLFFSFCLLTEWQNQSPYLLLWQLLRGPFLLSSFPNPSVTSRLLSGLVK